MEHPVYEEWKFTYNNPGACNVEFSGVSGQLVGFVSVAWIVNLSHEGSGCL